jgi:hypothetical protein
MKAYSIVGDWVRGFAVEFSNGRAVSWRGVGSGVEVYATIASLDPNSDEHDVEETTFEAAKMRPFEINRYRDVAGVSGTGIVAEGVVFVDGQVALTWLGEVQGVTVYDSIADVEAAHCRMGNSAIVYIKSNSGEVPAAEPVLRLACTISSSSPRRRARGGLSAPRSRPTRGPMAFGSEAKPEWRK